MQVNIGIINGYDDDTFQPDQYMTRAELVTVMDKLLGLESESDKYISDVTSKDWYDKYIRKAIFFGIIKGNEKGKINPNSKVTREEATVIIARAFHVELDNAYFNSSYKDANKISDWARKEMTAFIKKQYMNGYEDNTIKPKRSITRAEVLAIISRVVKNISTNMYATKMNGDTLIKDRNVIIKNVEFLDDLIVGEQAAKSIQFTNTIVNGNLILYAPIDMKTNTIAVNGKIIKAYENKENSGEYYINQKSGITFPVSNSVTVYDDSSGEKNLSKKDIIVIHYDKKDNYYYETIEKISKEKIKDLGYASIFTKISNGEIQKNPYELYTDNLNSQLLIVKRDNVVYSFLFLNLVSNNVIDNLILVL